MIMKPILILLAVCFYTSASAQPDVRSQYYNRIFEAKYMDKPPLFIYGKDSLKRFFYNHFPAFDTVINMAVKNGDTAKFIRIYFSFNLDENGYAYEPQFDRVASSRSAVTESAKTIKYFNDMKDVLKSAIKQMLNKMPQWKPGLQDGRPVKTHNSEYMQFWVGLTPPQ